ncbi:T9SS type A sorting domain-containing protein [Crocinitomicaceae bacterium]|nr:T9SS type A sorting domain-containing protein [Crocinitomicaceae bacterium]
MKLPFSTTLILILGLLLALKANAQFTFQYNDSIPVIRSGDTLQNPWAGGLNYIQMSDFDFDQDGDMDLFCFDRSSNNVRVFAKEWDGNNFYYDYVLNTEDLFPTDLRYRAQLVDFDQDGRKDLFTWGLGGGLKVYRNVSDVVNGLQWILFQSDVQSDYAINGMQSLFISADDLPALVDVDEDGDLDILTSDAAGLRLEYHQNQSIQLYGIPDSLIFVQKNECWGKFTEGVTNFTINLNDSTPPCINGNIANPERSSVIASQKKMHAGTSILCLDIDSSGVKDIIMGDAAFSGLNLLVNGGTAVNTDSPITSLDDTFPIYSTPVKCQNFPGAYYVDVDFDQKRDLIASPNTEVNSLDRESVIYYQNIGTDNVPIFTPISGNFLQDEMIEHGTGSIPVIFDYNGDGLEDLLIANFYNYKPVGDKESLIAVYYNVGTATEPAFQFVDMDAFNLGQQNFGLRSVPTFGDIDDDGDKDLLLGLEDGTLVFYENLATGTMPLWGNPVMNYLDDQSNIIDVGAFAHPQLFDLNDDGLLDLMIGNRLGTIAYYENIGSTANPSFQLNDSTLGEVDILPGNQSSNAAIHFFRENGETHLICGSFDGNLTYFDDIDGNLNPGDMFNLVSDTYQGIDVGKHSAVYTFDLDMDGNRNLFLGQDLGGLYHYDIAFDSTASLSETSMTLVSLYPNPTEGQFTVTSSTHIETVKIIDAKGRLVQNLSADGFEVKVSLEHAPSGIYYAVIQLQSGEVATRKLIRE